MQTTTNVPAILQRVMDKKKISRTAWGLALTPPVAGRVVDIMSGKQKSVTLRALDQLAQAVGYENFIAMANDVAGDPSTKRTAAARKSR